MVFITTLFFSDKGYCAVMLSSDSTKVVEDTITAIDTVKVEEQQEIIDIKKMSRKERRRLKKNGGVQEADSTKKGLSFDELEGIDKVKYLVDSLRTAGITVDSITIDSIARQYFSDTLTVSRGVMPKINADGSLTNARILDSLIYAERLNLDNGKDEERVRVNIFRDTIPFGQVSTLAIALPGYGQAYNKQYWKIPVLYSGVAALTYAGTRMGSVSRDYKQRFNNAVAANNQPEIDRLYGEYKDYQSFSTLLYVGAGLTYMYFLADAAFNYKGIEDSKNRATYLAFMFPGAGQIYNKQYWKLPIVYGGIATFAYVINFNGRGYTRYKTAYEAELQDLPHEFSESNGMTEDKLLNLKNSFRRARDMAVIYTIGFYLLTVVDAYVSASFKQYDVSDDLSLQVAPTLNLTNQTVQSNGSGVNGSLGLSLRINF